MNVRYIVELTDDEHQQLDALTRHGKTSARSVRRAQILLAAHDGISDKEIVERLNTCTSTVYRTKRK